jgi:hypothetical protein
MTDIANVRLKIGDKSTITREVTTGDGTAIYFKLGHQNILADPAIQVRVNGILVANYTVELEQGIVTFSGAPAVNDEIDFQYYWAVYNDAEIQIFLDEAGGNITIASAKILLAMAADASRLARRLTLSGGAGGTGQISTDTSVAAKELRATAKALIDMEADLGESIPTEQLTEPIWTEFNYEFQFGQSIIRKS